jgi:hypothetical protein
MATALSSARAEEDIEGLAKELGCPIWCVSTR